MSNSYKKYLDTLPNVLDVDNKIVLKALIMALAKSDDEICAQIQAAKDQLFVKTASDVGLDIIGDSRGVSRPENLGLSDEKFRELIPNLSLKPKQIKKAFYDTADVFWGPLFSRANISAVNSEPYNISVGDSLSFKIDNGPVQEVKVLAGDIQNPGSVSASEVVALINKGSGITAEVIEDVINNSVSFNVRTNTPGSQGSIEILDSPIATAADITLGLVDILDLPQRVSVYNINPNELIIEIPANVPTLTRGLRGAHHFHADATLETTNEWKGSFIYDASSSEATYTVTSQVATLDQELQKGQVYPSIDIIDGSNIIEQSGFVIFNFGLEEEVNVAYRAVPNTNTLLLDPTHVFQLDHSIGSKINVVAQTSGHVPNPDLNDFATFVTSSADSLSTIQAILERLAAAGVIIRFRPLAPSYTYLIDNPYLSEDDGPTC